MKTIKCYHISPINNREKILKEGLIPNSKNTGVIQYNNRVFVSTDKNRLAFDYVDFNDIDVYEFEISESKLKLDEFADFECFRYIEEKVDKNNLKLIETIY